MRKAVNAMKSMVRGAIKIGVTTASGSLIQGTVLDSAEKGISDLLAEQVDTLVADRLQNATADRMAIDQFRKYLEEFAITQGNGNPIVFVIDELDRCRPDFALDLLEQIKHLFAVPGIVFLLILNRTQLEETIKVRYGTNVNGTQYLQKFVNLWLTLPRKTGRYEDFGESYVDYALKQVSEDGETYNNPEAAIFLRELAREKRLSCREIERILGYIALFHNMNGGNQFYASYQILMAFVCYLKASNPSVVGRILQSDITADELIEVVGTPAPKELYGHSFADYLEPLIRFDLATDAERRAMEETGEMNSRKFGRLTTIRILKTVSESLSAISMSG